MREYYSLVWAKGPLQINALQSLVFSLFFSFFTLNMDQ